MAQENVRAFVRQALGCDCDESVFEHIENEKDIEVADIILRNKINVGNRLLVYIVDASGPSFLKTQMPALLEAGRKERDGRGFNRFRLVLLTGDAGALQAAHRVFDHSEAVDEKVHMHILSKNTVSDL